MAGQVADALQGLTQYLFTKNQQLDKKDQEKRVQLAAEHIAEKFQQLPPDADPREMQQLQFELIEDAAALGGLQENLPLISGLYSSALQTRQLTKQESQDEALGKIISQEFGIEGEGLSGAQKSQLAQLFKQYETQYQTVDEQGYTFMKRFDMHGKEIFNLKVNALGTEEQFGMFKRQALFQHGLAKDLLQTKAALENAPDVVGPDLEGYKFIPGQQGPNGELLYKDAKGKGLYTLNKKGQVVKWDGRPIINRKGAGANITDVLKGIRDTQDTFSPIKFQAVQELIATKEGEAFVRKVTGQRTLTERNKQTGKQDVSGSVLAALETYVTNTEDADINAEINALFADKETKRGDAFNQPLNKFALASRNQQSIERQLYEQIPESPLDNITDPKTWNEGQEELEYIFENVSGVDSLSAPFFRVIGDQLGIADSTYQITYEDYGKLPFETKQQLNEIIVKNKNRTGIKLNAD